MDLEIWNFGNLEIGRLRLRTRHWTLAANHWPLATVFCLLAAAGCGQKSPFRFVQVSGTVTYDDGSLIPEALAVTFHPAEESLDGGPRPRPATAFVDKTDGRIGPVTSFNVGDGLPPGKYKATLSTQDRAPLPPGIVPPEYGDLQRTPLEVDTAEQPFKLQVRRPAG